jgi:hypothetical protein
MIAQHDTGTGDGPITPTIVAAWTFQGLFLAALAWDLASEPLYLRSAGPLSLQFLVELVTALPAGLSAVWLIGNLRVRRGARSPIDPWVRLVDCISVVSITLFLGTGVWILFGGPLSPVGVLGGMPVQLFIAYLAVAPAMSGVVWLILRIIGGEGQRRGLRNADQAAAKRSAQL